MNNISGSQVELCKQVLEQFRGPFWGKSFTDLIHCKIIPKNANGRLTFLFAQILKYEFLDTPPLTSYLRGQYGVRADVLILDIVPHSPALNPSKARLIIFLPNPVQAPI